MIKIAASLSADFSKLAGEVRRAEEAEQTGFI